MDASLCSELFQSATASSRSITSPSERSDRFGTKPYSFPSSTTRGLHEARSGGSALKASDLQTRLYSAWSIFRTSPSLLPSITATQASSRLAGGRSAGTASRRWYLVSDTSPHEVGLSFGPFIERV